MSLDLYFFRNGFDIQRSRADIDAAYTQLQAMRAELEELEDNYEDAKLASLNN